MAIKTFEEWLAEHPETKSLSLAHSLYLEGVGKAAKPKAEDKPEKKKPK